MTDMKRITISLPDDINQGILDLKKTDEYVECSYAEIVRMLLVAGLSASETDAERESKGA